MRRLWDIPGFHTLRKSLRVRLAIAAMCAIVVVGAVGTYLDYRLERADLIDRTITTLRDQARLLALGLDEHDDTAAMQTHVRRFCETLNSHVSPGHVVIVLYRDGQELAVSAAPTEDQFVARLAQDRSEQPVIQLQNQPYAQARIDDDGRTIIVAQKLTQVHAELDEMLWRHFASLAVIAICVIGLLLIVAHFWAIRPLRRLREAVRGWQSRDFAVRAPLPAPSELREVTQELDRMAEKLHRHEQHRLADLEKARKIQHNLLPKLDMAKHGIKLAGRYWPLDHVAGDLYDVFDLPDGRLVAAVIDVAGHGVSAALLTGVVKMSLRYQFTQEPDLPSALELVNRDVVACTLGLTFAVLSIGIWDKRSGTWTYAACGHEGCTVYAQHCVRHLTSTGPMLGMMPNAQWETCQLQLDRGDRIFLYSDGVTEAGVTGDGLLGTDGIERLLSRDAQLGLEGQVEQIMLEAKRRGQGEATDDITMLAFEVEAGPISSGQEPNQSQPLVRHE